MLEKGIEVEEKLTEESEQEEKPYIPDNNIGKKVMDSKGQTGTLRGVVKAGHTYTVWWDHCRKITIENIQSLEEIES